MISLVICNTGTYILSIWQLSFFLLLLTYYKENKESIVRLLLVKLPQSQVITLQPSRFTNYMNYINQTKWIWATKKKECKHANPKHNNFIIIIIYPSACGAVILNVKISCAMKMIRYFIWSIDLLDIRTLMSTYSKRVLMVSLMMIFMVMMMSTSMWEKEGTKTENNTA